MVKRKTIQIEAGLKDNLTQLKDYWSVWSPQKMEWDTFFRRLFPMMADYIGQDIFGYKLWSEMLENPDHPMRPSRSEYELKLRELQRLTEYGESRAREFLSHIQKDIVKNRIKFLCRKRSVISEYHIIHG